MGAGGSTQAQDKYVSPPVNPKPAKPAAQPNPTTNTNPSKPPSAGGPSTPPKPAAKHNNDKVITDEADPDSQSTSAVLLSDFVYDDCVLDLTVLSPKMQVRNSKGAFLGALTIPLKLRFIHPPKRNLKPNLKFDFYDFSLVLTENEVNEEFIHNAHGGFKDINVSQLLQTRPLKVDKILNYELTTLIGRSSRIKCIRVSPDDKRLVACSHDDLKLIMYDLSTSREVLHYEGHEDTIMYCAFSRPEGKYLVSASRDATCIIWDVATAKVAHTLQHQAMVICCNYSPDGKYIVTGSQDKLCRIWEAKSGKEITTFSEHGGLIIMCAFSPVCYNVVSCSADHSVMIWEARTGKCRHVLKGHAGIVLSCDWSFDNLRIVSNDEKTLRFWNAKTGEQLKEITVESKYPPQRKLIQGSVVMDDKAKASDLKFVLSACAPNGYVVCSANNRMVQILDPNSGDEVLSLSLRASVYTISCGSKNVVVLGDANGNIYVLKLHLDSDLQHLPSSAVTLMQQMGMRDELKEAD